MNSFTKFSFIKSFIDKSESKSTVILCSDINRDFCNQIALFVKDLGVDTKVYEIIKAERVEKIVNNVLKAIKNPLFMKLVVFLFIAQPVLWLALKFIQIRVSREVLEDIKKSDSVIWISLHEDFDILLLVDSRVKKTVMNKHALLLSYPSKETAEKLNIPYMDYFENYLNACNTPWEEMRAIAEKLKNQISLSNTLRVQTELGTDFKLRYESKEFKTWYGLLSERALSEGRILLLLPAGEFYIASVDKPLNIDGRIYFDLPNILFDRVVSGVEVVVKNGYVVNYNAEKEKEVVNKYFKHKDARKIHELGFGLNPAIKPCGSPYLDEKAYRTIHIGFGRPWTPIHVDFVVSNPRIHINGYELAW